MPKKELQIQGIVELEFKNTINIFEQIARQMNQETNEKMYFFNIREDVSFYLQRKGNPGPTDHSLFPIIHIPIKID